MRGLRVADRDYSAAYDRSAFGQQWADVERNGCDQRNDVLGRDLVDVVHRQGTNDCVVASGTLREPYSGSTVTFERGPDTSLAVQIDHVVALADAWWSGAAAWTGGEREFFANDPLNLLAVDGDLNQIKGAASAAEWLPPNGEFHCEYIARQAAVKSKYGLSVTAGERDVMLRVLSTCGEQLLPADALPLSAR